MRKSDSNSYQGRNIGLPIRFGLAARLVVSLTPQADHVNYPAADSLGLAGEGQKGNDKEQYCRRGVCDASAGVA